MSSVKYPLKLAPVFKDAIWGGARLKRDFGANTDLPRIAESWVLSDRASSENIVLNGELAGYSLPDALREFGEPELPLLVKLIDAQEPLSVQVHPDDAFAQSRNLPRGKTEMWYILDAVPNAHIYLGLSRAVTPDELRQRIADGTIEDVLRRVPASRGNVFFIPAGTIHALGGGILLAEVQQSSDTTYRVYDYNRLGTDGAPRELHIDDAVACANLTADVAKPFIIAEEGAFYGDFTAFRATILNVTGRERVSVDATTFLSAIVVAGQCELRCAGHTLDLAQGDSVYLASGLGAADFDGRCEVMLASV
ncbi:MAG: class I mannose-6-phosphate isomerase [Oscillospiraceae bacterium]|jgi:mannose-6-phosphate isomerase|nr:class I mannose-6-phosphate isomerase [Oscillospiraceae bacterium]